MASISRAELFSLLDERIADPSIAPRQDRELWERCGAERGIFVIDLSGFTRLTRAHGILHFLTVYRRATKIIFPAIKECGGRIIKCEADNVLASFLEAKASFRAARRIVLESDALNATLGENERVHPCIAIGFGRVLELTDDFFGDEVNVTFKLGEDVAKRREILVTEGALERLAKEGESPKVDEDEIDLGGVSVHYYRHVP